MIITPTERDAPYESSDPTELLIKEARQKARRRRLRISAVLTIALAFVLLLLLLVASGVPGSTKETTGNKPGRTAGANLSSVVIPHFALPIDIAVSGSHAWVVNNYESLKSPLANSVIELNVSNGSLVRVISLSHIVGGLHAPNSIAVSGAHVWVTDSNRIIELNANNGSVVRVIKAKPQSPVMDPAPLFAITASGTKIWVANLNSVIEINASNGSVERVINAKADRFSMPIDIAVSGSHVWVMNNVRGDRITELNASNGSLVRVINPKADVFGQNGFTASGSHVWITNWNANSVIELNAINGSVARVIRCCAFAGIASPSTIAVGGNRLWVTTNLNSVIELNAINGSVVRVIKARADGYDYSPTVYAFDDVHVWVVNSQSNSVTELNASNGSLVRLIK